MSKKLLIGLSILGVLGAILTVASGVKLPFKIVSTATTPVIYPTVAAPTPLAPPVVAPQPPVQVYIVPVLPGSGYIVGDPLVSPTAQPVVPLPGKSSIVIPTPSPIPSVSPSGDKKVRYYKR
jgi:hypothetical protein